jgi:hypothetical protein
MQRSKHPRKSIRCRDCPFWAPPNRCLDRVIKSGHCGDWVWYIRGGKQCRRRYAYPKDPETIAQMRSRGRLAAASSNYSKLTEEQRFACIEAGAKLRSRTRLGQSGALTGQQYSVRKDYARQKAQSKATELRLAKQLFKLQGLTRSTSGPPRSASGVLPDRHRRLVRATPSRLARPSGISAVSGKLSAPASPKRSRTLASPRSRGVRTSRRKLPGPRRRRLVS